VISEVAAVLAPVLVMAAIGYAWRLTGAPFDMPFVTRIIMYVAGPCLVFTSLSRLTLPLSQFWGMVGAMIVVTLGVAAVSAALIKILGLPLRSFLPALTLGNTGNLGLPLCLFAFGEEGLGLAVAVYVTNSLLQFTFVPLLHTRVSVVRTLFSTPMLYGAALGLAVLIADVHVPVWLANTLSALGDLLIPLMLMALGNTIGSLKAPKPKAQCRRPCSAICSRRTTSATPTTSRASCWCRRCSARSRCRSSCRTRCGSRAEACGCCAA